LYGNSGNSNNDTYSCEMDVPPWLSLEWPLSDWEARPFASPYTDCGPLSTNSNDSLGIDYSGTTAVSGHKLGNAGQDLFPLSPGDFIFHHGLSSQVSPFSVKYSSSNATSKSDDESFLARLRKDDDGDSVSRYCSHPPEEACSASDESGKPKRASISKRGASVNTESSSRRRNNYKRHKSSRKIPRRSRRNSFRFTKSNESCAGERTTDVSLPSDKSKISHNLTERKYRERLNGYFETLLAALPEPVTGGPTDRLTGEVEDRRISKGEVLLSAMAYIRELETSQRALEEERQYLENEVDRLQAM
jgi:hypothetical protein